MQWEIVKATESDTERLVAFYDRLIEHLDQTVNYPKWVRGEYPAQESISREIRRGTQFFCLCDGELSGAFVLNEDAEGEYSGDGWSSPLACGAYVVIHALGVSPEARGKGVGGQMVTFCKRYAAEQGYRAIRMDVVPDNLPAKHLYEKYGFRFVTDADLHVPDIPLLSLYEYVIREGDAEHGNADRI